MTPPALVPREPLVGEHAEFLRALARANHIANLGLPSNDQSRRRYSATAVGSRARSGVRQLSGSGMAFWLRRPDPRPTKHHSTHHSLTNRGTLLYAVDERFSSRRLSITRGHHPSKSWCARPVSRNLDENIPRAAYPAVPASVSKWCVKWYPTPIVWRRPGANPSLRERPHGARLAVAKQRQERSGVSVEQEA